MINLRIADRKIPSADRNFGNYYESVLLAVEGLSDFLLTQMHLVMYEGLEPSHSFFVGCTAMERVEHYVEDLKEYMQLMEKRVADLTAEKLVLEGKNGCQCQVIPEITKVGGNP